MTFTYNWKHKEACFGKPLQDQVDGGTHISFEIVPKKDGKYIAVQREGIPGHQPQAGLYFCHDLIRYGESVEACVKRLVQDQMGISVVHFRIVDIESDIQEKEEKKEEKIKPKKWYHKFRWFYTSDGFFVVGGRDATTNEIVIKKHTEKGDLVFHTDMAGSPFFVISTKGKQPSEEAIKEVADATITFSKAWKLGLTTTDVFWVTPDQVSKTAKAGEFVPKGAFMIYGKTNYVRNKVNLAIGMKDNEIMAAPLSAIKANCKEFVEVTQGRDKPSTIAKKIQKKIGGDLDDIIRALPGGTCQIKK